MFGDEEGGREEETNLLPSKVHANVILSFTSKPTVEEETSGRHTNDTQKDNKSSTLLTKLQIH